MKNLQTFEEFLNESLNEAYNHPYEVQHEVGDEIDVPPIGKCKVVEVGFKPKKMYSNPWTSISKEFTSLEQQKLYAKQTHKPANIGNNAIRLETLDSYKDPVILYQYKIDGKVYSQYAYMT
jgi:hypothetical protein